MKEISLTCFKEKKNYVLIWVSLFYGWGLKVFYNDHRKCKNRFFFLTEFSKILNIFFGFYKCYKHFIKVKGMGFKITSLLTSINLRLGFSHRILFILPKDIKFLFFNKQLFLIFGRDLNLIKNIIYKLTLLRKANTYIKKGIYIKGVILKIKESNKKSKF